MSDSALRGAAGFATFGVGDLTAEIADAGVFTASDAGRGGVATEVLVIGVVVVLEGLAFVAGLGDRFVG